MSNIIAAILISATMLICTLELRVFLACNAGNASACEIVVAKSFASPPLTGL